MHTSRTLAVFGGQQRLSTCMAENELRCTHTHTHTQPYVEEHRTASYLSAYIFTANRSAGHSSWNASFTTRTPQRLKSRL